jgi:uncharacterized protein Yka (UPF0111/DUF47 family)
MDWSWVPEELTNPENFIVDPLKGAFKSVEEALNSVGDTVEKAIKDAGKFVDDALNVVKGGINYLEDFCDKLEHFSEDYLGNMTKWVETALVAPLAMLGK